MPTTDPSSIPTIIPTKIPTAIPTDIPTQTPTNIPTESPTISWRIYNIKLWINHGSNGFFWLSIQAENGWVENYDYMDYSNSPFAGLPINNVLYPNSSIHTFKFNGTNKGEPIAFGIWTQNNDDVSFGKLIIIYL